MATMPTKLEDKRLHQTLLCSPQKMATGVGQHCRGLDALAYFGRWRTLTIIFGFLFERRPAWRCLDFATVLSKSGTDQPLASEKHPPLPVDSASLSLSHTNSSTPQLDSKS